MRLGTETGSLVNHMYSRETIGAPAPTVGMGATMLGWSDRHGATIVKVTPKTVHVQRDHAQRTDSNGISEAQTWVFTPNPNASVEVYRLTKRGWRAGSSSLAIGYRSEYYDFSF